MKLFASNLRYQFFLRIVQRILDEEGIAEIPVSLENQSLLRAENFPKSGPLPWLDRDDAEQSIEAKLKAGSISPVEAKLCRKWREDGYLILPKALPTSLLDDVWENYEKGISSGKLKPYYVGGDSRPARTLNPHIQVPEFNLVLRMPRVLRILNLLLGQPIVPFQTLGFHIGSEQKAHSDSIHMTTYPLGYLAATWVAVEDVHPDSGPLEFYPGSHRLPYAFSHDVGIAPGDFSRDTNACNMKYERAIAEAMAQRNLKPQTFLGKKGDVFLWHANLIHGGSRRNNPELSRKSIVCHYFAKGVLCYHDFSGLLAQIDRAYPNYKRWVNSALLFSSRSSVRE